MKCIWRDSVRYTCIEKLYIPVCWAKFSRGWFYSGSFLFFHEMNVNLLYRLTVTLFDIAHPVSSLDADNIPQFIILKSFFNVKFSDLYSHWSLRFVVLVTALMKLKQSSLLSCSACFRIMCFYCPTSGTVTRTGTLALQGRVSKGNVVGRSKVRQKTSCDTQ